MRMRKLTYQHMYELNNKVRLINVTDYPIDDCDQFLGFICGIVSQDNDLEEMYLDSFLTIAVMKDEEITRVITTIQQMLCLPFTLFASYNLYHDNLLLVSTALCKTDNYHVT